MDLSRYIVIAKVGKHHGLKGEFILHLFGVDIVDIPIFSNFFRKENDQLIPLPPLSYYEGGGKIYAQLENINSKEDVKLLNNCDVYVLKEELPPPDEDEYYYDDLIGCHCYYHNNEIGTVKEIQNHGSCDIFEVVHHSKKYYIPFLNDHVVDIQIEQKRIDFKNLDGFL